MTATRDIVAAARVVYTCLWVNQGMANFIEVYEEGGSETVPAAMMLVDFGSGLSRNSKVLNAKQATSVIFIIERLKVLIAAGRPARLDRVVISHQDTDHWGLMNVLLGELQRQKIKLEIGQVWWAGEGWKAGAIDMRIALGACTANAATDLLTWGKPHSDYYPTRRFKDRFFKIGNVTMRALVANAPIASSSPSIQVNGSGAMVVVEFEGAGTFLLPGDATVETLDWATNKMAQWELHTDTAAVRPCAVMSAPHHGSQETLAQRSMGVELMYEVAAKFVDSVRPHSVAASAGAENKEKHPYLSVLEVLSRFSEYNGYGGHFISFWDDQKYAWDSRPILKNIYTTILDSRKKPVIAADLIFTLYPGNTLVTEMSEFPAPLRTSPDFSVLLDVDEEEPPVILPPGAPPTAAQGSRGPVKRVTARRGRG